MATAPGESFYGEAIAKTLPTCWSDNEDDRVFRAVLVAETTNSTRTRSVSGHPWGSSVTCCGTRRFCIDSLFDEIRRRGYDGGFCEAVMRGGTPDKPNIGTGFEVGVGPLHGIPYDRDLSSRPPPAAATATAWRAPTRSACELARSPSGRGRRSRLTARASPAHLIGRALTNRRISIH